MKVNKLNQVLAVEKGIKTKVQAAITELYHKLQKPALLSGLTKVYEPLEENGMRYPSEAQKVQLRADEALKDARKSLGELLNITAQKDYANCSARADVVCDGRKLLENVPVTYLLFLEKQLTDLRTMVAKIPTLDDSEDWNYDAAGGVFKSCPVQTTRTQKVQKAIVLYPATPEHPAQTQLVSEDVVVGNWTTVKQSGALTRERTVELLERLEKLLVAIKAAREDANSGAAPSVETANPLFSYLFD